MLSFLKISLIIKGKMTLSSESQMRNVVVLPTHRRKISKEKGGIEEKQTSISHTEDEEW